ncbi:BRcat domain-containing protein [Aliarcobacter lanthieri]|uniref:BRcat domain-containing protein n=1 Tax=Aliarcobacter lanthieri TaxID=1355374 RepID=UPI003AFAF36B
MKIKHRNEICEVYIISWYHIDSSLNFSIVSKNYSYEGLSIVNEKDCEIIDDGIGKNYVIKKNEYGFDNSKVYIVHRVLLDNPDLWDKLWESEKRENVVKEFYEKLKDYETDNDTLDFTAIPIDDNWVFCPIKNCKENFVSFEVDTKKHIVKCPECSTRMYNPYFQK